jgi:hypothetical protein
MPGGVLSLNLVGQVAILAVTYALLSCYLEIWSYPIDQKSLADRMESLFVDVRLTRSPFDEGSE